MEKKLNYFTASEALSYKKKMVNNYELDVVFKAIRKLAISGKTELLLSDPSALLLEAKRKQNELFPGYCGSLDSFTIEVLKDYGYEVEVCNVQRDSYICISWKNAKEE